MNCRFCNAHLDFVFADFGAQPPSNAYLRADDLLQPEVYYPLKVYLCLECRLVQVPEFKPPHEIFDASYAYFSGVSKSWLQHAEQYVTSMIQERRLGSQSQVVELASNDGYLLQYFVRASIPCYGVEPSASVAEAARAKGVDTVHEFFDAQVAARLAEERGKADLIVANNVLAHVPDLNSFVAGIAGLLKRDGLFTGEFPHLLELMQRNAFDTIYHEHYSYFSLQTIQAVFEHAGLCVFDAEVLPTHGGSLRIHAALCQHPASSRMVDVLQRERQHQLHQADGYAGFQAQCDKVKNDFLQFLLTARADSRTVGAYGAAAKANTLLNYCGVKDDLLPYVADLSPHKQGMYMPGSHIEIVSPEHLYEHAPDFVVILPWNLREEIGQQLRQHGMTSALVTAVPELAIGARQ